MSLTPPELLQDVIDRTLDDEWGEFLDDDDLRLLEDGSPASVDFEDDEDD